MKKKFLSLTFLIYLLCSCSAPKNVTLFQGIESLTAEQKEAMTQKYVPRICIDDALIITVTSPDRESVIPFSPPPYGYYEPGEDAIGIQATTQNLFTYLVDDEGYIYFPVLGRIHVAGMSINESIKFLQEEIRKSAPQAVVSLQIANFKVGIFGEVKTANVFKIKTPRLSILDLIALAGDVTVMADRKNVLLIRDNDGEKEHIRIDLTDPAIFSSPYYYLQQNDMVYVAPNEAQKKNTVYTAENSIRLTLASVVISAVSIITSLFLTLRGQNL
ncbi:MAG: polysaccharide biosynthesis/export family protein [Tannerella sp.]|jgi:polysaccharide export outer membrane protein|nr:polysaccharide biosynthesis/export family protein [Tannerella sp.]